MQLRNELLLKHKTFDKIIANVKESIQSFEQHIHCYSFEICYNPLALKNWFVRFIKADISNPDKIKESYSFFCFSRNGEKLDCSPVFERQEDQAMFFESMIAVKKYDRI